MANDRLRDALMTARVTHEQLADDLGVHTKTVERWITQDRKPYPQFRHRISVLVQKDETWLWPNGYSRQRRGEIGQSEVVRIYPYRADVPRELWARLFENADENIGILVYSGFFLPELHATTLYNSIFWFDDDMLVNTHVYGVPAHFAPVLHLRHLSSGTLFQTYARSFDRVWDQTRKTWTGQKVIRVG